MAGAKNHDYHILPPDIWPLIGAISGVTFTSGMVLFMHDMPSHWPGARPRRRRPDRDLLQLVLEHREGSPDGRSHAGGAAAPALRHDPVHRLGSDVLRRLVLGVVRLSRCSPNELTDVVGGQFPPKAIEAVMDPFALPLLNTLILLCSGTTVTWAHHSLIHGDRDGLKKGLMADRSCSACCSPASRLTNTPMRRSASAATPIGSAFYMATGFHGFHVLVGTIFLIVCLIRAYQGRLHPAASTSASKRPPGTGTSSTWCGCSCSWSSTSGAAGAQPYRLIGAAWLRTIQLREGQPAAAQAALFGLCPRMRIEDAVRRAGQLRRRLPRLRSRLRAVQRR